MPIDASSFVFIISLAAVVNGLGIVRWLNAFAEYIRRRSTIEIRHYRVFTLLAVFQFLLHILFWWSLWNIRGTASVNFLSYLYLLSGPVLLFVGTAILSANLDSDGVDLREHYAGMRKPYATVLILTWVWAIFLSPVLRGSFIGTSVVFAAFLLIAVVQRLVDKPVVQTVVAVANWILIAFFVAAYQFRLGGTLMAQ